jgi:hypothetical protein
MLRCSVVLHHVISWYYCFVYVCCSTNLYIDCDLLFIFTETGPFVTDKNTLFYVIHIHPNMFYSVEYQPV